ncbi:MAG TPA: response regulator transcription factor [Tepidisphaeraceae bacterium]|nr:response regulator transcription factor [Tepidisphaeraceae bacterium]HUB25761.1 response regulator transcription factor [Tepidisphaeraceae bacterium]
MRIKLVIADEQRINREGLRSLFSAETDMEVIGEADNGRAAVQMTQNLNPDVVLMGMGMPGLNSIDATRQMIAVKPAVRVIGLANEADGQRVRELLAAGGAGFITRFNGFAEIAAGVRSVVSKHVYLSPDVAQVMVDQYVLRPPGDRPASGYGNLTPREREVLQLVAEGLSTKEAAAALKISSKTVDMHRQHIMSKLQLRSVAELTKYAIREGITALHGQASSVSSFA